MKPPSTPEPAAGPTGSAASARSLNLEIWSAISVLLVCLTVGGIVLGTHLAGHQTIVGPVWVWLTTYVVFLAAVLIAAWAEDEGHERGMRFAVGLHVVAGWATVLLTHRASWTPILLVFALGIAVYYRGERWASAIVVGNTAVIVTSVALGGGGVLDMAFTAVIYVFLQISALMFILNEKQVRDTRDALQQAHLELRTTNALLAESTRNAERLRIARELHDVMGHQLTALALELEVASHQVQGPAHDHVVRARMLAKDLLADVRTTVGGMRTTTPQLRAALETVTADLPNLSVHLEVADDVQVDDDTVTALVRCTQEIVTNVVRHARAQNVWITLDVEDDAMVFAARDDGRGAADLRVGNGLKGMRERIEHLGGSIVFLAEDGFQVLAHVPGQVRVS